ncbi:MAG: hypothetical protein M0Z85_04625 [Gammaproteobacteria bacterium]|nr:hypothetical protein [Gammaproteobacteria bacterium]
MATYPTNTKKRLSPTVYYLLTGIALSWPGLVATGRLLPLWRTGETDFALSLATIHDLVLAFMLSVAFGVLYQIVPIAFRAPAMPRHVFRWHLPVHVAAVTTMIVGFLTQRFAIVGVGGSALFVNMVVYFGWLLQSYFRAKNRTPVHRQLGLPFLALWSVVLIGIYQALFPGKVTDSVLMTHVMVGGFAFWGGLVLILSYKLLPMFAISHGYRASLARTTWLYFAGMLMLFANVWGLDHVSLVVQALARIVGGILMLLGLLSFGVDMTRVMFARKRLRIVRPVMNAVVSIGGFIVGQIGILLAWEMRDASWLFASIYAYVFGGLIPLMFSFMQKIVPFLWFEYRFSKRPERKTAPLIDDMVPRRTAQTGYWVYMAGVAMGVASMLGFSHAWFDWLSAGCLAAGSLILFFALQRVLRIGGHRPDDDLE